MSEPKWTPAQRAAIEDRGGALLVSAAAGSGKKLDKRVLLSLCLAWVTTFPACFYLAKILYTALKHLCNCA